MGDLERVPGAEDRPADGREVEPAVTVSVDEGLDRIVTVPNVITMVRLLCIPVFLWLLFGRHEQTAAAILLAVLGATDWVDGFVARRYGQVSTLGKVLDPIADRVLVGTAVISVMVYGAVPLWFGIATIAREVLVSVMVLLLASLGASAHRCVVGGQGGHIRSDVRLPDLPPRLRRRRLAGADQGDRLGHRHHRPRAGVDCCGQLRRPRQEGIARRQGAGGPGEPPSASGVKEPA